MAFDWMAGLGGGLRGAAEGLQDAQQYALLKQRQQAEEAWRQQQIRIQDAENARRVAEDARQAALEQAAERRRGGVAAQQWIDQQVQGKGRADLRKLVETSTDPRVRERGPMIDAGFRGGLNAAMLKELLTPDVSPEQQHKWRMEENAARDAAIASRMKPKLSPQEELALYKKKQEIAAEARSRFRPEAYSKQTKRSALQGILGQIQNARTAAEQTDWKGFGFGAQLQHEGYAGVPKNVRESGFGKMLGLDETPEHDDLQTSRILLSDLSAERIHDRYGAAVTGIENYVKRSYMPDITRNDNKLRLDAMEQGIRSMLTALGPEPAHGRAAPDDDVLGLSAAPDQDEDDDPFGIM